MRNQTVFVTLSVCATVITTAAILATAGPLTPPPGSVASTNKTLDEVEPRTPLTQETAPGSAISVFIISQPGSYYLTGNVVAGENQIGVAIDTENVTLDLNGFTLQGSPGTTADGVVATSSARRNQEVRNGVVTGWSNGVNLSVTQNGRLLGIRADDNTNAGFLLGENSLVSNCIAGLNEWGFLGGPGSIFDGCVASQNTRSGFNLGRESMITDSAATSNVGSGIAGNGDATIVNCVSMNNGLSGIFGGVGAKISGCTASGNGQHGIDAAARSHVTNNTCHSNGLGADGAGILISSIGARIEGNTVADNDRGIDADSTGNLIIRNSASGNNIVNYDIVAGNVCFVLQAATSGAISGSSGGVSPGTDNPWANFSF